MYTFPDQMNWQFVQILMDSKSQSKLRVLDTDDVKKKTSLSSVQGKSAWYVFMVLCSFVYMSSVLHKNNKCPNSHHSHPVHLFNTWISRECKVQNRWISYRNMSPPSGFFERVTFNFPDLYWNSLTWLTGNDTLILWGDPKSRCSFRILNRIENRRPAIIIFCYAWLKRHSFVYV